MDSSSGENNSFRPGRASYEALHLGESKESSSGGFEGVGTALFLRFRALVRPHVTEANVSSSRIKNASANLTCRSGALSRLKE